MKAVYEKDLLVMASREELQLLQAGAEMQARFSHDMRDASSNNRTRRTWNIIFRQYSKLSSDLELIINSMPF